MKLILDLHTHTAASGHAYSTFKENVTAAAEKGIEILGVSDHGPEMPGGPHAYYFSNLKVLPREMKGVTILKGAEANIINYDGDIDLTSRELNDLDYVVASLHPPCVPYGDIKENTRAVIEAMNHHKVRIIGHPDDSRYPLDYEAVVERAKEKNIYLEINNSSLNPNSFRSGAWDNYKVMLKICKEKQAMVVFGSDAHIDEDIGNFSNCLKLIKDLDFPEKLVLNYQSKQEILEIFLKDQVNE